MKQPRGAPPPPPSGVAAPQRLALDQARIEAAKNDLQAGAVTPHFGAWREEIIALLNDALATEWVCVLRCRRHHFTAAGPASPALARALLMHANEAARHADRLARRIVQLGGAPDLNPDTLSQRSHASYNAARELQAMVRADLIAARVAVETYSQMTALIADKDPATRRLIETMLEQAQRHADELARWLAAT